MMKEVNAPVLLLAFNRPDTTQKVFNRIKEVAPCKLYIAIDGPRNDRKGDKAKFEQVLQITKNVDWKCDTHYLVREENLGCKNAINSAIAWALNNEDRVIIVEDDVLPAKSFFFFAEELLEKYKNNTEIAMISGNNYTPFNNSDYDYHFSKYGHIWGWATWKRVWDKFDVNLDNFTLHSYIEKLKKSELCTNIERRYYIKKYKNIKHNINNNKSNSWGPQFSLFRIGNSMLSIVPRINLSSNIGEMSSRTTNIAKEGENYYQSFEDFKLKSFSNVVQLDRDYDDFHFKNHINKRKKSLNKRIINKFKKLIKQ